MNVIGLVILLFFYGVILVVGVIAARNFDLGEGRQSELSMVAGRKLGTLVGIFTMTATIVGGGYINGTAESIATFGLVWTIAPFGIFIGLILGALIFARRMRAEQYLTMLDPCQERYGGLVVFLIYLASLCGDLFWTASILSALGTSLSVIIDINVTVAILMSSAVTAVYTLIGQMVSVAYTDVVQLLFITGGLVISIPFAMTNKNVGDISSTSDLWLGVWENTYAGVWVDLLITMTLGTIPWQAYFQRVLSVKSGREAQVFSVVAAFGAVLLAIPPFLIGAVAVTANWTNTGLGVSPLAARDYKGSMVLPLVLYEFTPAAIAVIGGGEIVVVKHGLGAICAAVMSSMDSSILASSSMFTHNIMKPIFFKKADDRHLMWVQRATILVLSGSAAAIALFVSTIYGMFIMAADIVFIIVLPQLTCAVFMKSSNAYGALLGFLVGLVLRVGAGEYLMSLPAYIKFPYYDEVYEQQLFPFRTLIFLCSLATIVLVSIITNFLFDNCLSKQFDMLNILERRSASRSKNPDRNTDVYHVQGGACVPVVSDPGGIALVDYAIIS